MKLGRTPSTLEIVWGSIFTKNNFLFHQINHIQNSLFTFSKNVFIQNKQINYQNILPFLPYNLFKIYFKTTFLSLQSGKFPNKRVLHFPNTIFVFLTKESVIKPFMLVYLVSTSVAHVACHKMGLSERRQW